MMDTEDYIQSLQLSNVCLICKADLQEPKNAMTHYSSKRHDQNVKIFRTDYLLSLKKKQNKTALCDICNVQFPESDSAGHYKGDEHKRKEETYCKTCKVTTSSKNHLWQHFQGSKHKTKTVELGLPSHEVQYGPFDSTLPLELTKEMSAELCKLCNAKLPSMKHAFDHYKTSKHSAKVQNWIKERRETSKTLTSRQSLGSTTTKKKESKAVTSISQSRVSHFKCLVCKLDVQENSAGPDHKTSFPHVELARLKSTLVCAGILEEYWIVRGPIIVCAICNVSIGAPDVAKAHFGSRGHGIKFNDWYVLRFQGTKVLSETAAKWFYCRVCSEPLDGTSDAEKHYVHSKHLKNRQLYCNACNVFNTSEHALAIHRCTPLHLENSKRPRSTTDSSETSSRQSLWPFVKEQGQGVNIKTVYTTPGTPVFQTNSVNSMSNKPTSNQSAENKKEKKNEEIEIKKKKPETTLENKSDSSDRENRLTTGEIENKTDLKTQIMDEIKKMVQNLYWSKTVPHEVALDYLRKINKEVEELKNKYEKNTAKMSAQHENRENGLKRQSCENGLSGSEILSADEEFHSFNSSQFLEEHEPSSSYSSSSTTNDLDKYFDRAHSSNISICSKDTIEKSSHENPNDISDVPEEGQLFGRIKSPIASTSYEVDAERMIGLPLDDSDDLDQLLQQIVGLKNQVDDHLERDVLTEIEKLINLVNSDCIPPDETLKCLQYFNRKLEDGELSDTQDDKGEKHEIAEAEPEIKYRYSGEDLYSLRTEKTFSDPLSSQLTTAINQARIWNKHCNNMNQMASEGCKSAYDYYSGDNFMKFAETYLQGSLNSLSLQNTE